MSKQIIASASAIKMLPLIDGEKIYRTSDQSTCLWINAPESAKERAGWMAAAAKTGVQFASKKRKEWWLYTTPSAAAAYPVCEKGGAPKQERKHESKQERKHESKNTSAASDTVTLSRAEYDAIIRRLDENAAAIARLLTASVPAAAPESKQASDPVPAAAPESKQASDPVPAAAPSVPAAPVDLKKLKTRLMQLALIASRAEKRNEPDAKEKRAAAEKAKAEYYAAKENAETIA